MTRTPKLFLALASLALAAGAVAVAFTWQRGLATFHDDSASYLVMAQALSPWQTASASVMAQMPYEKYPPLFPLLLALSGAAFEWHWAHFVVAVAFAASVFFLGVYAARAGASAATGAVAALLYIALPGVWLNLKGILSEFPYMAITFGALAWMAARTAGARFTRRDALVLALFLAGAMLTRTIGFTLAIAVAIAEIATYARARDRARLREVAIALALAGVATIAWYALRPAGGDDAYLASSAGVVDRARAEGAGWIATLAAGNASAIFDAWLNALVIYWGEPWQPKFLACAALAIAGLAASAWRAWKLEADGLYVLLFLAVLIVWPFPGQMYRLALPVFPLVLALTWCAIAVLARVRWGERISVRAGAYAAALPLAFCVPALFYIADRARLADESAALARKKEIMEYYRIPFRPDAEASAGRQLLGFDDMARIRETTPEGARVMGYGPAYIALLASRRGLPLDVPADAADMAAQVRRAKPDYVFLSRIHPRDSAHRLGDPLAPARLVEGYAEPVWWRAGADGAPEAALFRIRPDRLEEAR
ncbi:MAG TPA: hypothetical protein VM051_02270 [Usitatibacter sp.]|nr:hypothetical protein [Usitatibacter sp.]